MTITLPSAVAEASGSGSSVSRFQAAGGSMKESDSRSRSSGGAAPATTSGGGLAVVETGDVDAPLVALVHGSMDRMAGFTKLTRRLGDRYRVLRYDRRGYGQSRAVAGPYTIATHVDDLIDLLAGR
jgi:alpha-beta hydrolase superfamily lysophospholipase